MTEDPAGFYARLGVAPTAPMEALKTQRIRHVLEDHLYCSPLRPIGSLVDHNPTDRSACGDVVEVTSHSFQ